MDNEETGEEGELEKNEIQMNEPKDEDKSLNGEELQQSNEIQEVEDEISVLKHKF